MRAVLVVLFALAPALARADVIPPDYEPPVCAPVTCPRGAIGGGGGGHGSCPSVCVPWSQICTTDAECGGPGWSCVPTRFCLEMRPTGRMIQDVVVGECADDGSCAVGTCTIASRCTSTPETAAAATAPTPPASATAPAAPAASSSSCAAGAPSSSWGIAGVLAALVLARRRAR